MVETHDMRLLYRRNYASLHNVHLYSCRFAASYSIDHKLLTCFYIDNGGNYSDRPLIHFSNSFRYHFTNHVCRFIRFQSFKSSGAVDSCDCGIRGRPGDIRFGIKIGPLAVTHHIFRDRLPSSIHPCLQSELLFKTSHSAFIGWYARAFHFNFDGLIRCCPEIIAIHTGNHAVTAFGGEGGADDGRGGLGVA